METVFLSLTKSDFQDLIAETVNSCLTKNKNLHAPHAEADQWFDLEELCKYHPDKPSKATVYGWVNAGTIPVHKSAKKLRFLKSEIDAWLKQGRKKTLAETETEAEKYLKRKGGCHA
jgi:excisionase family DNA binding protein